MSRSIVSLGALAALLLATPARAGDVEDYDMWVNQPKEPFGDGDATLREIRQKLLKNYYRSDITAEDLDRAAAQGMMAFVDAKMRGYNRLLTPQESAELQTDLKGELVGIGVIIDFDPQDGLIDVNGVIAGSPAAAADVREGDKILAVDGQTFKGKQDRDLIYAMRGKLGTQVKLGLLRDAQVINKTITRARVQYDPVSTLRLPDDIFVLQIRAFVDTTPAGVRAALAEAAKVHARALIVDLRDDSGGTLEKSIETARLLLPRGKVVGELVHRGGKVERFTTEGEPVMTPLPTAVLVNGDTRSSAELVAASLRENLGAPLIGSKTFGKWSVQALDELPNKYVMKYTVGMLRAPSGHTFDGQGMSPDVEVALDSKVLSKAQRTKNPEERLAADVQLRAAHNLLRMRP